MGDKFEAANTHPGGEPENHPISNLKRWPLDTPGGRFHAEWETQTPVTREGQLIFFFQFLNEGGRWERLMENTPLRYTGSRGSGALAVFGTLLLSILNGHYRYAHINTIRGDGVNPELLGMKGSVSEDTVRRALKRVDKKEWKVTFAVVGISVIYFLENFKCRVKFSLHYFSYKCLIIKTDNE